MRLYLIEFLKALEAAVPTFGGHHGLSYCRYGSDTSGWTDKLGLHVRLSGDRVQTFFIEEGDLDKSVDELVTDIVREVEVL